MIDIYTHNNTLEVFSEKKDSGEQKVFDTKNRKPQVAHMKDGRKIVNGVVEFQQEPLQLWGTTIQRGVVNEFVEETTGTKYQKAKRYVYKSTYDAQVFLRQQYRLHPTPILISVILFLILFLLYVCRIFPFN